MRSRNRSSRRWSALRPTPALVVAFVALFAAMGGFGYAAVKIKQSSVKTKNIKNAAVTTDKIADGAVTTPKLAPDAVAPATRPMRPTRRTRPTLRTRRSSAASPRAGCQTGWLKASLVVDTDVIPADAGSAVVPGFDCASNAQDAVQIKRTDVGRYLVTFADNDAANAVITSAGDNAVTAVTQPPTDLWSRSGTTATPPS